MTLSRSLRLNFRSVASKSKEDFCCSSGPPHLRATLLLNGDLYALIAKREHFPPRSSSAVADTALTARRGLRGRADTRHRMMVLVCRICDGSTYIDRLEENGKSTQPQHINQVYFWCPGGDSKGHNLKINELPLAVVVYSNMVPSPDQLVTS